MIVRPYQTIHIESLSKRMNISKGDVEDIAVALIQNLELDAKIDQNRELLVLQTRQKCVICAYSCCLLVFNSVFLFATVCRARDASKMYDALDCWTRALATMHTSIAARVTAHP
jgi:hypothetical protein